MSLYTHSEDLDITYSDIDKLRRTTNVFTFVENNLVQLNSYYQLYHMLSNNNISDLSNNIQIFKNQIINKLIDKLDIVSSFEFKYKLKHIKKSLIMLFDELSKKYVKSLIDTTRFGLSYIVFDSIDNDIKSNKLSLSEMLFITLESFNKKS